MSCMFSDLSDSHDAEYCHKDTEGNNGDDVRGHNECVLGHSKAFSENLGHQGGSAIILQHYQLHDVAKPYSFQLTDDEILIFSYAETILQQ
jgi:hypothetical protein